MNNFFKFASIETKFLYGLCIFLVLAYGILKLKKRKFFISVFSIQTYFFIFTIIVTGPFQYNDEAWNVLGRTSAALFFKYLDKNMNINIIGLIIYLIMLSIIEFKQVSSNKIDRKVGYITNSFTNGSVKIFTSIILIIWSLLIIIVGSIPVFGDRLIFNQYTTLKPIYMAITSSLNIITPYFAIKYIDERKKVDLVFLVLGITALYCSANRTPLITIILIFSIYIIYSKCKSFIKANILILSIGLIGIFGVVLLGFLRGEVTINIMNVIEEFAYGNTFCDIRDGAFILYGFEGKYNSFLMGKNYLADIFSFIPSSIMEFRQEWSYGYFTSNTLFGFTNHYGLRGGWFIEPYINFGYIGIIIMAILNGYFDGILERYFYNKAIYLRSISKKMFAKSYLVLNFISIIFKFLLVSVSAQGIAVNIVIFAFLLVCTDFIKKFNKGRVMI